MVGKSVRTSLLSRCNDKSSIWWEILLMSETGTGLGMRRKEIAFVSLFGRVERKRENLFSRFHQL